MSVIALKKLKGKNALAQLFELGLQKHHRSVSIRYLPVADSFKNVLFSVGVPKKKIPNAVDRNRLKRQLREAIYSYKNWKEKSDKKGVFMVFYNGRRPENFVIIERNVHFLLDRYFSVTV